MTQNLQTSLSALEQAGATHTRSTSSNTTSFEISGIPIKSASKDGVKYEWSLPRDTGINASFAQENLGKKFLKVFSKELQTGDSIFDDAVYVTTKNKELTAEFLSNEARRDILTDVVARGGVVSVNGARLSYAMVEDLDPIQEQEQKMCAFVTSLL